MVSHVIAPSGPLSRYVQLFWCLEFDVAEEFTSAERIAPDGIVELVLQYTPGIEIRLAGDPFDRLERSSLVCQTTRYAEIRACAPVGFISVRLKPWGALHFFDVPIGELANQVVSARSVWGGAIDELEESIATASTLARRISIIESFLLERLRRHQKGDVEEALRPVWSRGGALGVEELCGALGVSQRTAQRVFHRCVGMPPKRYSRLVRFLTACSMIRAHQSRSLSEVAYRCGYYDHAHLDGDFRAFAGMTPSDFRSGTGFSFLEVD